MKRRTERGNWSGVEWSGLQVTRFVKKERERTKYQFIKPHTVYNFSSMCVLFLSCCCCCQRREKHRERRGERGGGSFFLCGERLLETLDFFVLVLCLCLHVMASTTNDNKVIAILGSQWGDEGKGKVVDLLAEKVDIVARFNGGANAGPVNQ
jgi:hypothetical protein